MMPLRADEFFSRGTGPIVSVLLPTRGRPYGLCRAIHSLVGLSARPQRIEFLLRVDDDDEDTLWMLQCLHTFLPISKKVSIKAVVGSRGGGYADIHLWLDRLVRESRGDWLMNWSDDVLMQTKDWDTCLASPGVELRECGVADGIFGFFLRNPRRPENHEFFAVRREVFDVLGHLSLSPHVDTWLAGVLKVIDRMMIADINVEHENDGMNDGTAQGRIAVTQDTMIAFCSPAMMRARLVDAEKLIAYVEAFSKGGLLANGMIQAKGVPGVITQQSAVSEGDGAERVGAVRDARAAAEFGEGA